MSVSAAELASIQADVQAQTMDKTAYLYAPIPGTDAYGSPIDTYSQTPTATTVCGVGLPSAGELANYDYKIGDKAAYHVNFPVSTTIGEQWRVSIDGQVLEVHVILNPQSYAVVLPTICAQIK